MSVKVLIRFSHGLGDVVQFGVILKHLRKYRPDWVVDFRCGRGKHTAVIGLCNKVWHDKEEEPPGHYDTVIDVGFYENFSRLVGVPNTKITNCLQEVFGLQYDAELERYEVHVGPEAKAKAAAYFESIGANKNERGRYNVMVLHYEGNTSQNRKNLNWHQANAICSFAIDLGLIPVILDWDKRSPLPDQKTIFCPVPRAAEDGPDLWGNTGTGDAETITALIAQARIYIGVDSGPGKCASATDTPTLICWKELHPMQFHDPAENTVHLIPDNHENMPPCMDSPEVCECFKRKYDFRVYSTKHDPEHACVEEALVWMQETMAAKDTDRPREKDGLVYRWGFWLPKFHDLFCFWTMIEDVLLKDGYKTTLRPKAAGVEYVVDVGANIGTFAKLWHKRNPQAKIVCVEANAKLIPALRENVGAFATVIGKACYYPERGTGPMHLLDCLTKGSRNVGDSRVISWQDMQRGYPQWYALDENTTLETITLEQIAHQVGFPRIDILKLDCEGSEFNILRHADLSKIGTMFVEAHNLDEWQKVLGEKFRGWDVGDMYRNLETGCSQWHLVSPNPPARNASPLTAETSTVLPISSSDGPEATPSSTTAASA